MDCLSARRCRLPVLSVLNTALMGCCSSSLSSRYSEQICREVGKKAHRPMLELPHSCHSDTPDGPFSIGHMAKTDTYVLIRYRLEPSPNEKAASILHLCVQLIGSKIQ